MVKSIYYSSAIRSYVECSAFIVQVLTKNEPEVISNSYFRTILTQRPRFEKGSKQFFNPYNLSYIHPDRGHGEIHILFERNT